jgi:hypothetical protein
MPVTKYQYDIPTETAAAQVYIPSLTDTIDADGAIAIDVDHIEVQTIDDKLDVWMADALDAGQEAALTAAVLAHVGQSAEIEHNCSFSTIKAAGLVIPTDATWTTFEGLILTPGVFNKKVEEQLIVITGEHNGDGGQIELTEDHATLGLVDILNPFGELPDTLGAWETFQFMSNVPLRKGNSNIYTGLARWNGATNLSLRNVVFTFASLNPREH